jgi:hypothetical protein
MSKHTPAGQELEKEEKLKALESPNPSPSLWKKVLRDCRETYLFLRLPNAVY